MITGRFFQSAGTLVGFEVSGHDEADDSGISLLCAAVSSAAYLTVNALTDVAGVTPLSLEHASGYMALRLRQADAVQHQTMLGGLLLHLRSLSADHPKQLLVAVEEESR